MDDRELYKCIALIPNKNQNTKFNFPCGKPAELVVRVEQNNIDALGCYLASHFCLDHIPQLEIRKINKGA